MQEAARLLVAVENMQWRLLASTRFENVIAAGMERAAARALWGIRNLSRNRRQLTAFDRLSEPRQRSQESARVRMGRLREQPLDRSFLDEAT